MLRDFGAAGLAGQSGLPVALSGRLDALVAFERIGTRRRFARGEEIYAEGDPAEFWYRVVSGTVRISRLFSDGRRCVAEFCFGGECFGLDEPRGHGFSAEAVTEVVVMRYPRGATRRLLDEAPHLAHRLYDMALRDLAQAQARMLRLGRMTASERVASFLLELAERRAAARVIEIPMSRGDIADYLGLTIETVCRALSALKHSGAIAMTDPHAIELRHRGALEAASGA
jgi:CRP/FNR family nitrogen fixation transcriptional regulator